ncbi:carboxypeptidase-like regulatory domain-containing protein [Aquabacterium sp.]|uniref:carboxypeptidase-like regulatory domain-containing protein n=1 Tax=Aquabacterium sp. TaxID=1872578 RepID=UPI0019C18C3E|nr:carboxypeptidase-like regulatory domain-containing protein [Aquabacterium sp.]MBC7701321.1 carboxypeptidase regulatory-like domain-containing protein [Aquabacterium sp.]
MVNSVLKQYRQRLLMGVSFAGLGLLSACGGGGSSNPAAAAGGSSPSNTLSGTVAVGAPMADALVRILDSAGNVVSSGVSVDAAGAFTGVTLTGTGPYRIEACGHVGDNYRCVYSVSQGAGVANVTPLTTAAVLLATGDSPEDLMNGPGTSLDATSIAAAQTTLRTGLAGILADAGVPSNFDFISGDLSAGTRTGYDRVLDSVGVTTGEANLPFVQITPRLGTGNLYLESGAAPQGTLTVDSQAASVSLTGIETLFQNMSLAMANDTACRANLPGLLATTASMSFDGPSPAQGSSDVGALMCDFIGTSNQGPGFGVSFVSPTLGRCDLSGTDPICRVSFVLKLQDGSLQSIGEEMAVVRQAQTWKFKGDVNPIGIHANAALQRTQTFDSSGAVAFTEHSRAFQFDIQAITGLQCAKVSQKDASGAEVLLAYYKRYSGSPQRLSAWRDSSSNLLSNPTDSGGQLRSSDDTQIQLQPDAGGDAAITNFYRGGRTVKVTLYTDANCSSAMVLDGRSEFEVDMMGVPPLSGRMVNFPWPTLTDSTVSSLRSLTLATGASTTFNASWTFARGYTGLDSASFCSDRQCGDQSSARIGDLGFSSAAQSVAVPLANPGNGITVTASGFKMLVLYGRTGEGMGVQNNFVYCSGTIDSFGQCH